MPRPRKGTEEVFYDTFADFDLIDQAAALKVMQAIHRLAIRDAGRKGKPAADAQPTLLDDQPE